MKTVLVFDGDDTLWMNEWQYSKAMADFFAYLYSEFRGMMPTFNSVKQRLDEVDKELFPVWGIRRGRIFFIMLKVYHELLGYFKRKYGKKYFKQYIEIKVLEQERRIFEIGDQPFNFRELKWLDSAKKCIKELRKRDCFELCLLTSYDETVWRDKAIFLGAEEYFDRIKAVPSRKVREDFIEVSGWNNDVLPGAKFYAIGNGPSDILPALEISENWRGIYIPHGSTSPIFEKKEGSDIYTPPPIDNHRVITLNSIS